VLGGGLFLQPAPVAAVSKFIVALIGNRKNGKNKMTASKTASCSFLFSKIYFGEEGGRGVSQGKGV
jgi:acyl-CoA synthetase (NDP forming)